MKTRATRRLIIMIALMFAVVGLQTGPVQAAVHPVQWGASDWNEPN
jgi:hypothetical protein